MIKNGSRIRISDISNFHSDLRIDFTEPTKFHSSSLNSMQLKDQQDHSPDPIDNASSGVLDRRVAIRIKGFLSMVGNFIV